MSLTGAFFVEEVGCNVWEMEGNGRSAREDWNVVFLLGIMRCAAVRPLCDESASGEETRGRDIVIVAIVDRVRITRSQAMNAR